ncbi:MAG TPA: hypothetical protein VIV11_23270 [Kofleriaceae bacterium]
MRAFVVIVVLCLSYAVVHACKCSKPSVASAAAQAKLVFVGTITKQHEAKSCAPNHPTWCRSSFTYDVSVEGVFKGTVDKAVTVDAGHGRGDCSPGALAKKVEGSRWLFFTSTAKQPLFIHMCGGTQRATDKAIAAVTKKLGAAKAP